MNRINENTTGRLLLLGAVGLCLLTGCAGGGRLEVTPLAFGAIDPPAAEMERIKLDRCYWWTDDSGQVWIAMESDRPVFFGTEHLNFRFSLVFEKLPAGKARNYLVNKRELRGVARLGPAEARFESQRGIVALYREGEDWLRGSLRLQVKNQSPQILGGWSKPRHYLMLGRFNAVHDENRGRHIAEETESHGWEREPTNRDAGTE